VEFELISIVIYNVLTTRISTKPELSREISILLLASLVYLAGSPDEAEVLHHKKEDIDGTAPPDGVAILRQHHDEPSSLGEHAIDVEGDKAEVCGLLCVKYRALTMNGQERPWTNSQPWPCQSSWQRQPSWRQWRNHRLGGRLGAVLMGSLAWGLSLVA
jgi:hypothetical protein